MYDSSDRGEKSKSEELAGDFPKDLLVDVDAGFCFQLILESFHCFVLKTDALRIGIRRRRSRGLGSRISDGLGGPDKKLGALDKDIHPNRLLKAFRRLMGFLEEGNIGLL